MGNWTHNNLKVIAEKTRKSILSLIDLKKQGQSITTIKPEDRQSYIFDDIKIKEANNEGEEILFYIRELDMGQFIPRPKWMEKYDNSISREHKDYRKYWSWINQYYGANGHIYDASIENMSIIFENKVNPDPSFIEYRYVTKWYDNGTFVERLSRKYPTLTFEHEYIDDESQHLEKIIYKNGHAIFQDLYSHGGSIEFTSETDYQLFIQAIADGKSEFSFRDGCSPIPSWTAEDRSLEVESIGVVYDTDSKVIWMQWVADRQETASGKCENSTDEDDIIPF